MRPTRRGAWWLPFLIAAGAMAAPIGPGAWPALAATPEGSWVRVSSGNEAYPTCPGTPFPDCGPNTAIVPSGGEGSLTVTVDDHSADGHWTGIATGSFGWTPLPDRLHPGDPFSVSVDLGFSMTGNRAHGGAALFVTVDVPFPAKSCSYGTADGFAVVDMVELRAPGTAHGDARSDASVPAAGTWPDGFQVKVCGKADGAMNSWLAVYRWQAGSQPPPTAVPTHTPAPTPIPTPSPTPSPTVPSCSLTPQEQVAWMVDQELGRFKGTCFSQVAGLGDPALYRQAALGIPTVSITNNRLVDGALNRNTLTGAVWLDLPLLPCNASVAAGVAPDALRRTCWHEVTHELERQNGDWDAPLTGVLDYKERNVDHMVEAIAPFLTSLETLERDAAGGMPAKELRRRWDAAVAKLALGTPRSVNARYRRPNTGLLQQWTGARADPVDIAMVYLSGCAGPELRQAVDDWLNGVPTAGPVAPTPRTPPPGPSPTPPPSVTIVDTMNGSGTENGPRREPVFDIDRPFVVTAILTYHWNDGRGATPGTLALRAKDGTVYGPWAASGAAGQGGVQGAMWTVEPKVTIPPGSYTVVDSDPATWSHNGASGGAGFATVLGYPVP